jgi:competence protein ComEC
MKRPAIVLSICFVVGIVLARYLSIFNFIIICIIASVILMSIKTYYGIYLLIVPLVCFFGFMNIQINQSINNKVENKLNFEEDVEVECIVKDIKEYEHYNKIIGKIKVVRQNMNDIKTSSNVIVYDKNKIIVEAGDLIKVNGKIDKPSPPRNPGGFNQQQYFYARNIRFKIYSEGFEVVTSRYKKSSLILYKIKKNISNKINKIYPEKEASIINTMLLGDKETLSDEIKSDYKMAGISHLLAISGLHITIIGFSLFNIVRSIIRNNKLSVSLTICILILYCIITGSNISTVRATIMISIMLLSYFFDRKYNISSSLSISAIVLLVINPYQLFDVGFLLSYFAVIGIVIVGQKLNTKYNKSNSSIVSTLFITIGASLSTYPIILWFFYEIPTYGILINIIVVGVMTVVISFAIASIIICYIWMPLGKFIAGIIFFVLKYIDLCTKITNKLPLNSIIVGRPKIIFIVIYFLLIYITLYSNRNIKRIGYYTSFLIIALILVFSKGDNIRITALDVGQGDCSIIENQKKVYLIDGGGKRPKRIKNVGTYVVAPYLKFNGISKINGIFLSHSDYDHIYGIIEVIKVFKTDFIVMSTPYKTYKDDLVTELEQIAKEKNIDIYYMEENDSYVDKDLHIECNYPTIGLSKFENNNGRSSILNVYYKNFNILYTGDIEKISEDIYVKNNSDGEFDILKVPHHGSNTSSTDDFIDKVNPRVAIISYGENNCYGHPADKVVERYNKLGIEQYHTAIDGAIIIDNIKKNSYNIRTYYSKRKGKYKCKNLSNK